MQCKTEFPSSSVVRVTTNAMVILPGPHFAGATVIRLISQYPYARDVQLCVGSTLSHHLGLRHCARSHAHRLVDLHVPSMSATRNRTNKRTEVMQEKAMQRSPPSHQVGRLHKGR
ncbi:unnamed protein product [Hydatigera taeniaeformis]|nr:unnamed protein product [Hydatigera taeniaeformis]